MTGPNLLRLLVCLTLAVLLFAPAGSDGPGEPLRLNTQDPDQIAHALATSDVGRPVIWLDSVPPHSAALALLSGAARSRPTHLSVFPASSALSLAAPRGLVAGRRNELTLTVRGPALLDVPVTLIDPAGTVDTVVITPDQTGQATASLSVRPTRSGGARWTVTAGGDTSTAEAWVRPALPLRVLVLSQTPGWETRFLARALEEAGVRVSVRQELGRDLRATSSGADLPRSLEDLDAVDAVLLVGWPRDPAVPTLLAEWVQAGGGVLLSGSPPDDGSEGPLAPWAVRGPATTTRADGLTWTGPATLVPPPAAQLDMGGWAVDTPLGAVPVVAERGAEARAFAAAGALGRGRVLALGLGETWRLRIESGLVEEHRDFWLSLVEWLSGGARSDTVLDAPPATAGLAWTGRFPDQAPASILLHSPDGVPEQIETALAAGGAAATVRFLPRLAGEYAMRVDPTAVAPGDTGHSGADSAPFGTVASAAPRPASWSSAVLAVGARGGTVDLRGPTTVHGSSRLGGIARGLLFFVLAGCLATEWVWRRMGRQT